MKKLIKINLSPLVCNELSSGSRTFVIINNTCNIQKGDYIKFVPYMLNNVFLPGDEAKEWREYIKTLPINHRIYQVESVIQSSNALKKGYVILSVKELSMAVNIGFTVNEVKRGDTFEVYGE